MKYVHVSKTLANLLFVSFLRLFQQLVCYSSQENQSEYNYAEANFVCKRDTGEHSEDQNDHQSHNENFLNAV